MINPIIKAMFQIPEKLRDSLALNHYDEFQKKDEKAARNNMIVIEGRYGSFCYRNGRKNFTQGYWFEYLFKNSQASTYKYCRLNFNKGELKWGSLN